MIWGLINGLQIVFFGLWSVLWISVAIVLGMFFRELPLWLARRVWAPPLLWVVGARLEIIDDGKVDYSRPHIYVMNHQSMLDIGVAFVALPVNLRFIAKAELGRIPFLGWFMRVTGMITVERQGGPKAAASLRKAARRIQGGANILTFPEGTRSRNGQLLPFKPGIFRVAQLAGVAVVPITIQGADKVLPADSLRARPGVVRIHIYAPIEPSREVQEKVEAVIRNGLICPTQPSPGSNTPHPQRSPGP